MFTVQKLSGFFIKFTNIQFRESTPLQELTFLKNRNKLLGRSLQNVKQLLKIFLGDPRWRITLVKLHKNLI